MSESDYDAASAAPEEDEDGVEAWDRDSLDSDGEADAPEPDGDD